MDSRKPVNMALQLLNFGMPARRARPDTSACGHWGGSVAGGTASTGKIGCTAGGAHTDGNDRCNYKVVRP